jgi:sugar-specific transcriptional regulator TrmB
LPSTRPSRRFANSTNRGSTSFTRPSRGWSRRGNNGSDTVHEGWALSGSEAIANRTQQLIGEADDEIVLVLGIDEVLSDGRCESLTAAVDEGVSVIVGALADSVQEGANRRLDAEVFLSELEWLDSRVMSRREARLSADRSWSTGRRFS